MVNLSNLIDVYLEGINQLKKSVAGMTEQQMKEHPVAGRWSTLEVLAHIADFEPIFADRMKRIISHERPLLLVADENLFMNTLVCDQRDSGEEIALVEATRRQMARILRAISPDSAGRLGIHTFKGLISLDAVLTGAINHISHHLKFIEEKRQALGV